MAPAGSHGRRNRRAARSRCPTPRAGVVPAILATVLVLAPAGCGPDARTDVSGDDPEAISLLGQPLHPPEPTPERRAELEGQLAGARADYARDPDDADAIIWVGRRLAYLGRYREAIDVFGEGIEKHPGDARMYRHRGHRWITLRRFDDAIRDLGHAARLVEDRPDQVEPDGMPNPYGIPTSTLHTNIWYHLALAHYLKHDFERALHAWHRCMEAATNDDMRVATADWLYMTYRRLGRDAEAARVLEPIHADMEILENHAYHQRLLMYRGEVPVESLLNPDAEDPVQLATYGYGVANWFLYNGDRDQATALFRRIVAGPAWAAFGHIAAEAELAAIIAPLIEARLVHDAPGPGLEPAEYEGETLYLDPEPVFSDPDLLAVRASVRPGQVVLTILCSDAADRRTRAVTAASIGGRMAVSWESRVRSAPVVRSTVGCTSAVVGIDAPDHEAERIAEMVRARWPEERPPQPPE